MEMDDVAGNELKSNESVTKEIVICCYTIDLERPGKITEVNVIVLLQKFYFLRHLCFSSLFVVYFTRLSVSQLYSLEYWYNL